MPSRPTSVHTERAFETAIEDHLMAHGWQRGDPQTFDRKRALFPAELLAFIQTTQAKAWKAVADYHSAQAADALLDDLCKAIAASGMLHVLRHGFNCFGKAFKVATFAPASGLNPELQAQYAANCLTATRQVHYSERHENSLDMVLALNGLPLATAELKNPFTHQNVFDAMRQYRQDRDPAETVFAFNRRALVHFAVDPDLVFMTTRLEGAATAFLPFNRGRPDGGAGNPPHPAGHRTAYLWQDAWARDSWLDILGRFVQMEKLTKEVLVRRRVGGVMQQVKQKISKENLIFPRWHQLDAVRALVAAARAQGPGRQYLVQHSAGSGKSNTIAWLAHRLSTLHDDQDARVFDSVIVITDRRVLDRQLQANVFDFEHKQGVVVTIDQDSTQLAQALADRTPIIVTTLQKFPFVTDKMAALPQQRYAVIVDEAHSSQSGEQAAELKGLLNDAGLRAKAKALIADESADESAEESADEALLLAMLRRGRQPNISFFAFTATPKHKTLKIFDEPGPDGRAPFHRYSMRQAIEEHFIHDVLVHYTTYKAYYKLAQTAGDDPLVEKKDAAKALARYMRHHPHNIASKVEVMVEHFRQSTRHRIGGRAKAMVVTDSRLSAVRYKLAFDDYIARQGYDDIRTLVAFSGTVQDPDAPGRSWSEAGMNGFGEGELPERFATDDYQVLLVAEKYQTGFDEPLLHTMYVDKRLDGVQAVQTLSRLNRRAPGKEDTFVLDFYNERGDIFAAFKPYYDRTDATETTDAQKLYELKAKLDGAQVYAQSEANELCRVFFASPDTSEAAHARLSRYVDQAVESFKKLDEQAQDDFAGWLTSFRNLYAYLAQIIPYQDSSLERLYTYLRFLHAKLPPRRRGDAFALDGEVQLKFYKLQKIGEGRIDLQLGESGALTGPNEVGTRRSQGARVQLSSVVDQLNQKFGTQFTLADQLFFDQVEEQALQKADLREAALANTEEDFGLVWDQALDGLFIDRMEGNDEVFRKVMADELKRALVSSMLRARVYARARAEEPPSDAA
jgi:type I restriction enzyme, R subunit